MKKIEKYIIAVITLIAIGAIGTSVYFIKPIDNPNNNEKNKNEILEEFIPNEEASNKNEEDENISTKTTLTFYKNDSKLSSFKCDGECYVQSFEEENSETSDYYVKIQKENDDEKIKYLEIDENLNVIINYCQNEICDAMFEDYHDTQFYNNNERKNAGKVLIYNIKSGKYDEYTNISHADTQNNMLFLGKEINENQNNEEYIYTLILSDGFSRELTTKPALICYGDCVNWNYPDDKNVFYSLKNNKFGIEDIKTGEMIVEHEYEEIYSYDNNTYVAKKNGLYNAYNSKTNTKIFKNNYKIVSKINDNSYIVLDNHIIKVINEKEQVISKNNIEFKEMCDVYPRVCNGYYISEEKGKYYINICSADVVDENMWAEEYEILQYGYDPKTQMFEIVKE
ncbi:MAG: WG repeat-containing protein [Bacilli bacterium]|nr:WG repeat-containing protein [Bacilli bacterium]